MKHLWKALLHNFSNLEVKGRWSGDLDPTVTVCQLFWHTLYALPFFLGLCLLSLAGFVVVFIMVGLSIIPFIDFFSYYIFEFGLTGLWTPLSLIVWFFIGIFYFSERGIPMLEFIFSNIMKVFSSDNPKEKINPKEPKEPSPLYLMYKGWKDKACYKIDMSEW